MRIGVSSSKVFRDLKQNSLKFKYTHRFYLLYEFLCHLEKIFHKKIGTFFL